KGKVNLNFPLIVMVDNGFWIFQRNHFMVVVGYNEDGIIVNSGREQLKFIPLEDFLRSWRRTEFWSLLITPKQ
ncbi:MAG: peptidase C39 family protein, partial [Nitrospirota bacterium]